MWRRNVRKMLGEIRAGRKGSQETRIKYIKRGKKKSVAEGKNTEERMMKMRREGRSGRGGKNIGNV